jgi:hypothetical protein
MKIAIVCVIVAIGFYFGLWPKSQEDKKAEVRRQHRDARYSNPAYSKDSGWPGYSKMPHGSVGRAGIDYVDLDSEERKTPEKRAAWLSKLSSEHTVKRASVICNATVIVFGKIVSGKGYITSDDSSIYTVYNFVVSDIYRSPHSFNISIGSQIEVTVPGGIADIGNGKSVGLEDSSYAWLAPGIDHVLALKYDAEADDYYVFDPIGVYKVFPDGVIVRGDAKVPYLARRARLAGEPSTIGAVMSEMRGLACSSPAKQ